MWIVCQCNRAGRELTPSAKYDFKFKDYAPWVFRHLRARFKLDPADYLMSLTSKYILSELGSPGKSGSFFYFSRDYKYIIKTIHHSEHKLLRRILRDYYEHVDKNPNTLISQFYGLHRVKMAYGRKIHFVVMNNLFPPHRDIHQMFDLKGSTVGRDYREEDLARNPRATMKDLNWLRREKRLHCGPLRKDVFMTQVKRDVALLQRLNIMDYSLLVGMHDTRKGNDEQLRDRALQVYQPGTKAGQLKGLGNGTEEQARQSADSSVTGQDSVLAQAQGPRLSNLEQGSVSSSQSQSQSQRYPRPSRQSFREISIPLERMKGKSVDEILDQTKQLVFYSEEGGFRATNQAGDAIGEIYYLGIIDCLTTVSFMIVLGFIIPFARFGFILGWLSGEVMELLYPSPPPFFHLRSFFVLHAKAVSLTKDCHLPTLLVWRREEGRELLEGAIS